MADSTPDLRLSERRLNSPQMYRTVLSRGSVLRHSCFTLRYYHPTEPGEISRIGFIIRKKTGNAWLRNALRRRFRETFRLALPELGRPIWIVFDVPPRKSDCTLARFRQAAEELLQIVSRK